MGAIQKLNPPEMHWPGYQYMGPFNKLKKRLKRGDPGINRLDKIAKQHDIEYARAKSKQDKWNADRKMVKSIDNLPGKKRLTEKIVRTIIKAKQRLKSCLSFFSLVLIHRLDPLNHQCLVKS